jgi:hypothetical protein
VSITVVREPITIAAPGLRRAKVISTIPGKALKMLHTSDSDPDGSPKTPFVEHTIRNVPQSFTSRVKESRLLLRERMKQTEILEKCIYPMVDEMKSFARSPDQFNPLPEVVLFGQNGSLDSLNLVTFLVGVEGRIEDQTGRTVRLVSEKAMSRKHSPFRTLRSLAEYVEELLCEST